MSSIAQELDATLQRIDPQAAQRVTRLVREILLLAEARGQKNDSGGPEQGGERHLLDLAEHAEPMGALNNSEIDQAMYGR